MKSHLMVMFPIGSTGSYASAKAIIMTPYQSKFMGRGNAQYGKELEKRGKTKQT
jgi:hypothetical protein